MLTIGINEGINSSVVVSERGKIIFALQEERLNKIKEYIGFPELSLQFALNYLNIKGNDIDNVCLSNIRSPRFNREMFLSSYDEYSQSALQHIDKGQITKSAQSFLNYRISSIKNSLKNKLNIANKKRKTDFIEEKLINQFCFKSDSIKRTNHHLNHAAAAYFGCRKNHHEKHLVLTLDGGGDGICSSVYVAEDSKLQLVACTPSGHSLGNLYSRVTYFMGMTPHEHEYKLMGLAAYGKKEYSEKISKKFSTYLGLDPSNPLKFKSFVPEGTYRIVPRLARDFYRTRFDNLAAGMQDFTEDILIKWITSAINITGIKKVVAAGGVFMNVKANKRIAEIPGLEFFDVFPSCGDETLPFGAVWLNEASLNPKDAKDIIFESLYLGPNGDFDIKEAQKKYSDLVNFESLDDPIKKTAELISNGDVVARCSGKMEFGARALGNRSILADPKDFRIVPKINNMIKKRDFWMPFAPAMTYEKSSEFINIPSVLPSDYVSQWMMHSFETTDKSDSFSAGVHAQDKTARAQVVNQKTNPEFHKIIKLVGESTGNEVVLNTSFNIHGFPIVTGSLDAIEVLLKSGLKYLVIENNLITKK